MFIDKDHEYDMKFPKESDVVIHSIDLVVIMQMLWILHNRIVQWGARLWFHHSWKYSMSNNIAQLDVSTTQMRLPNQKIIAKWKEKFIKMLNCWCRNWKSSWNQKPACVGDMSHSIFCKQVLCYAKKDMSMRYHHDMITLWLG